MYFNNEEDERDPFEAFGETDASNDDVTLEEFEQAFEQNFETTTAEDEPAVVEPQREIKVKTGFSWAGFAGGLAALVWIAGAIGGAAVGNNAEASTYPQVAQGQACRTVEQMEMRTTGYNVVYEYAGQISVPAAIGVLRIVEHEILEEQ